MNKFRRYLLFALALVGFVACSRDTESGGPRFGGPAEVTLVLRSPSSRVVVDYGRQVHSIRIYAFKHGSSESVGYAYFDESQLAGYGAAGPYYCQMALSASGPIDFFVLLNDRFAEPAPSLDDGATPDRLKALRLTGVRSQSGSGGAVWAIPMSNEIGASNANFTYQVVEQTGGLAQLIRVEVKRAMARLTLNFAKEGEGEVTIDRAVLRQGPADGLLAGMVAGRTFVPSYTPLPADDVFLDTPVPVTAEYDSSKPTDESYRLAGCETYMLPNPVGSLDPDRYAADNAAGVASPESCSYLLDITYTVAGATRTKTVCLPVVHANDQINVWGVLRTEVNAEIQVEVVPWTEIEIDVPPFE